MINGSASIDASSPASRLQRWLCDEALPYWATQGTDLSNGGFFERIARDGSVMEEPRRTRVVTRQIYVFSTALRHEWIDIAADRIEHGLHFLFEKLKLPSGTFAASVNMDGSSRDDRFDLYEHAFVLFALAAAYRAQPFRTDLPEHACRLLERMTAGWSHPEAGFYAAQPAPSATLLANPHMHLFEAALEWSDAVGFGIHERANKLADEMAELCMRRLIDPLTGAVSEYFDATWNRLPGPRGRVVEPGHQFEWAWLLMRWGISRQRPDALLAARRLVTVGEVHGVDAIRGLAINELDSDLLPTDTSAKLWPQTERTKAWSALADHAKTSEERARAQAKVSSSAAVIGKYIDHAPRGRWNETCLPDGSFSNEPTRASSLYHIVCAIDTLVAAT